MELRQIQYFLQLYKDCNISKSSQALFISQQGLSKSVSKLETELGFPLFRRSSSGVIPTESAHKLYGYFKKVQDSFCELEREIAHVRQERILKIIAPHGFALATDTNDFTEYGRLYPEAATRYVEESREKAIQDLAEGKGDIAFMMAPIPDEFQSHQIVGREPLYAVLNRNHFLADRERITISDLEGQEFLLLDLYEEYNEKILKHADHMEISYSVYGQAAMNEYLPVMSAKKEWIGFSSKQLYQYYNFPDIVFLPFFLENGSQICMEFHLVTLKDIFLDQAILQYIDYEKEKYGTTFKA